MPKTRKVTLLDRAKADLKAAKFILTQVSSDEVLIDVCAYHCQQCIEKIAKHMITMQGDNYATDHRMSIYLEDLHDGEIKTLIENINIDIDAWATFARYRNTILASRREVDEIVKLCDEIVNIAEKRYPNIGNDSTVEDAVKKFKTN